MPKESRRGIEVTGEGHHTSFKYNGILFENHGTDVKWDFNFRRSDYRTLRFLDRHAADALPGPEGFPVFPHTVTAVFLVKHLKQHLRWNAKVNVKQFTDLALLLRANPDIMDDVLPLPRKNNILLQYSIVARDIIVDRLHRITSH